MEEKIQLLHPEGKSAVRMDKLKYDLIRTPLLMSLKSNAQLSHTEILRFIEKEFEQESIEFKGSIEWHMQSVKMDLEAKKEIKRTGKSPIKYVLVN